MTESDLHIEQLCKERDILKRLATGETTTISTKRLNLLLDLETKVLAMHRAERTLSTVAELLRLKAEVDASAEACERGSE